MSASSGKIYVEPMRIPVFVSCPSALNPVQEKSALFINDLLTKNKLAWRALGRSDYSYKSPLTEVVGMVKRCSGGIVLGFSQYEGLSGTWRGKAMANPISMPTAWNHLEAGIMFSFQLPILVFREKGIAEGVFDLGTPDVFIHDMPEDGLSPAQIDKFETLIQNWASDVRRHYYAR